MIIKHAVIMSNRLQSVIFQQVITHTFVIAELIRTHRILTEDNTSKYLLKNEFKFFFLLFCLPSPVGKSICPDPDIRRARSTRSPYLQRIRIMIN